MEAPAIAHLPFVLGTSRTVSHCVTEADVFHSAPQGGLQVCRRLERGREVISETRHSEDTLGGWRSSRDLAGLARL